MRHRCRAGGELIFRLVYHQAGVQQAHKAALDFLNGRKRNPGGLCELEARERLRWFV